MDLLPSFKYNLLISCCATVTATLLSDVLLLTSHTRSKKAGKRGHNQVTSVH